MPLSVEQTPRPTLQGVLKRLEPFVLDPPKKRAREIGRLTEVMRMTSETPHVFINTGLNLLHSIDTEEPQEKQFKEIEQFYQRIQERDRATNVAFHITSVLASDPRDKQKALDEFREYMENFTAAYLFHINRSLFDESTFNPAMEQRQMEAAAALLSGNHLHLGTGEGKSAVILPIVGIVKSLVSKQHDAILSTGNEQLLEPLRESVRRLLDRTHEQNNNFPTIDLDLEKDPEKDPDPIPEALLQTMQKEALLHNYYSETTKEAVRNTYWTRKFEQQFSPKKKARSDFLQNPDGKKRIVFLTERQLVFAYMEDKKSFKQKAPAIIMDEAHIPYDRGTPYETEQTPFFHSPEDINQSVSMWLANFIVAKHLRPDDFYYHKGVYSLDEHARERIKKEVDLSLLYKKPDGNTLAHAAFSEGVAMIAQSLGLNEDEKKQLAQRMREYLKIRLPSTKRRQRGFEGVKPDGGIESPTEQFVTSIADTLASIYKAEGKSFVFEEKERDPQLRDTYLDEVLRDHTHQPDVQTAIYALFHRFKLIPTLKQANQVITFDSFVADNADKIVCASGSILYRDLATGALRKGGFGHFIESVTKSPIHFIESLHTKESPHPYFYETNKQSIDMLVKGVFRAKKAGKPGLVVCFDRNEGEEIFQACSKQFGSDRVVYIPLNPHPDLVKKYCTMLADGELDAIITAGNLGVGVDIKKSDGTFPNLKVFIHGLPLTQLQIWQAIGRRRLEGTDAAWYISKEVVESYISHFEFKKDLGVVDKLGGKISREEIEKRLHAALTNQNPEENLELAASLIRENEKGMASNYEIRVLYDRLYTRLIKKADELLREKVIRQMQDEIKKSGEDVPSLNDLGGELDWLLRHYGLPELLYWTIYGWASFPSTSQRSGMIQTIHQDRDLINTWLAKKADEELPGMIQRWFRLREESVDQFRKIVYKNNELMIAIPLQFSSSHPLLARAQGFALTQPTGEKSGFGYIFTPDTGYRLARLDENGTISLALQHEGEKMKTKLERGEEKSIDYVPIYRNGLKFQVVPTSLTNPEVQILLTFER